MKQLNSIHMKNVLLLVLGCFGGPLLSQKILAPQLVDAPSVSTVVIQPDSLRVSADDWYFCAETGFIYLLRQDSLFSSPLKPLDFQFLGSDTNWRIRKITHVWPTSNGVAVLFEYKDIPEDRNSRVKWSNRKTKVHPMLWFSSQKTVPISPAPMVYEYNWHLISGPLLPSKQGCFIYSHLTGKHYSGSPVVDSTSILWVDLRRETLTNLPFSGVPEFYDTTLRFAYFRTGNRLYPELNRSHDTYDVLDMETGKIGSNLRDVRFEVGASWVVLRGGLAEKRKNRKSTYGYHDHNFDAIELPDGRFAQVALPKVLVRDYSSDNEADSIWTDAVPSDYLIGEHYMLYQVSRPGRLGPQLYSSSLDNPSELVLWDNNLLKFSGFGNDNGFFVSQTLPGSWYRSWSGDAGKAFFIQLAPKKYWDIFQPLRREPGTSVFAPEELTNIEVVPTVRKSSAKVLLVRLWQGYVAKEPGVKGENPDLDAYWERVAWSGVGPRPMHELVRYGFLSEDGHLTIINQSFLKNHLASYRSLIFHPSGVLLERDWDSGDLLWWGFDMPK